MGDYSLYRGRGVAEELRKQDSIANALIIKRRYPGNQLLAFLLVEGDTDKRLYRSFTDEEHCAIHVAYSKSTALDTLAILEQSKIEGVLAIVDADFDVLEGKKYASANLLLTDAHDAELMIVQSPAFEKVLREFGSEQKIAKLRQQTGKDIRALLLDGSKLFGYTRWVSLKKALALKFEGLELQKCFERRSFKIDEMKTLDHISNKAQRHVSVQQMQTSIAELQSDEHDPWHLCCGHDLTNIFSWSLRTELGTHNSHEVTPSLLETSLRLAYEYAYFKKTHLYVALQNWEMTNTPFVILRKD